ncbi:MAG TPA: hypothetical protein VKM55_00765 [Candidatus Lokiarchaeia archaeon]|nr:hypothetical protein [Candidatus Lokiarchaeia archaeon]
MEKTVHLLSAGIDSPVAGYLLVKSGIEPIFLTGDATPFATNLTTDTAMQLASKIAMHAGKALKMYILPHGPNLQAIQATWNQQELKYTCIFCKRMLYRVAKALAIQENAQAISTGEIIGEQASQTIDNMALIQESVGSFIVIRPLLTWDKVDVIKLAREIGTFDISNSVKDPCKAVPKYPMTHGKIENYRHMEAKVEVQSLVDAAMEGLRSIMVEPAIE